MYSITIKTFKKIIFQTFVYFDLLSINYTWLMWFESGFITLQRSHFGITTCWILIVCLIFRQTNLLPSENCSGCRWSNFNLSSLHFQGMKIVILVTYTLKHIRDNIFKFVIISYKYSTKSSNGKKVNYWPTYRLFIVFIKQLTSDVKNFVIFYMPQDIESILNGTRIENRTWVFR